MKTSSIDSPESLGNSGRSSAAASYVIDRCRLREPEFGPDSVSISIGNGGSAVLNVRRRGVSTIGLASKIELLIG